MFISKSYGNLISGIFTYKNYMYMLKSYLIIELHVHILQCQRAEVKIKTASYKPSSHSYSLSRRKTPQPLFVTCK